ncbi:MAG: gamma-glutamyl-gamma-aminobutyrate hydrolase family protein [Proteobacteria bacterium]|nr:gamma-glutamyl-gamma-aminobutyrate hydrolase family protein [Pseudomonadota bacterium]MBU1714530.1 gamma-glutamyl-gamma-aminobutyrate hydrolase family protein [Pseudomonadota bacterium]
MRILEAKGYCEPRDALAQDWANFLGSAMPEAAWLPIPNLGAKKVRIYCEKWCLNRLILTGGEDIGVSPLRDETENDLLVWANERAVPVLGVCRGMQMLGIHAGSNLKPVRGHVRTRHKLSFGSVNSYHNLSLDTCPHEFHIEELSEDGEIEAISHKFLPWEGWMWHPEREKHFAKHDILRLHRLMGKK